MMILHFYRTIIIDYNTIKRYYTVQYWCRVVYSPMCDFWYFTEISYTVYGTWYVTLNCIKRVTRLKDYEITKRRNYKIEFRFLNQNVNKFFIKRKNGGEHAWRITLYIII